MTSQKEDRYSYPLFDRVTSQKEDSYSYPLFDRVTSQKRIGTPVFPIIKTDQNIEITDQKQTNFSLNNRPKTDSSDQKTDFSSKNCNIVKIPFYPPKNVVPTAWYPILYLNNQSGE